MIYDCLFERSDSALTPFEMHYDYLIEMIFRKQTVFCTPAACSECLPIESWPNSIGKHPAEKNSLFVFSRWYMTFVSKWATAITTVLKWYMHCHFEMTNDYPFKMSNAVLYSFRYDLWLSFRNDGAKIFVHKNIFVNSWESNPRDENGPLNHIFSYTDFFAATVP